ncbi:glycosyltransferase family 39 protein [Microcoleus sp. FACHB-1515]|uniref:ArnT family glycosyltransferase n=1 Tax=Cyanophyceae TaxID=3028117 RepID=UPI001685F22C|nr:glycosyltransferase family 39 protein [Microcoleus sp. FACHB-1515]MBD2090304.1 glycosyltransferase family 39 protein [Microcoleus sp. FACHB-1515]
MRIRIDRPVKFFSNWEKQPAFAWAISLSWVLLLCAIAFGYHLGSIGLVDETEPLFAEAARQMVKTGDWITPYYNGHTRFDKPPLVYWLMAIGYRAIGVNEWAVRLPSALAATALTVFGFVTLRKFGYVQPADGTEAASDRHASTSRSLWLSAWIGAALMALNAETLVWARTGVSDMLLSGCMGTALMAFFWGYATEDRSSKTRWYFASYVLCALAVLTKGPVGVVLPILIVGAFLLYVGQLQSTLREMHLLPGALLFLAITLPWYFLVIRANGDAYINSFFGYHNIERFTSVVNDHAAPWYFYFIVVLVGFLPWSLYLPIAISRWRLGQRRQWQSQPRSTQFGLFALFWFAVIFGFFTIAVTKLPSYVLPLMPAAAILVGLLWSDQMQRPRLQRSVMITAIVNLVFLVVLAGVVLYSANWMGDDPAMPNLPETMRQSGVLIWGGLIWVLAAAIGALLLVSRQGRWLWSVNAIAFAAFILFTIVPAAFLMDVERQLPLRQIAATIRTYPPTETVLMVGFEKPSLVFYTQRSITYLSHPDRTIDYLRRSRTEQPAPQSALVLGYPDKLEETRLRPRQYDLIQTAGAYQLWRVPLPLRE